MPAPPTSRGSGAGLHEELLALHGVMRRGTALVADSFARLSTAERVDPAALASASRWLVGFIHHHHWVEDDLLWPVLRELSPRAAADLTRLTTEHESLDAELDVLAKAADAIAGTRDAQGNVNMLSAIGYAAVAGNPAAQRVQDVLANHLASEEAVLKELFPRIPDGEIARLRKGMADDVHRGEPHFVLGLMTEPEPVRGYAELRAELPVSVRLVSPLLVNRYRAVARSLGAAG
jgi:hemerythrin-like domain-containing protein